MTNSYHKLKSLKTLLIDDDPFIRNSMELAFGQKGFPLRVVKTGEEGLRVLDQEAFDIVISDYRLPGMNGLDFFRQVISKNAKTIKVLISASVNHDAVATAYALGISDYLPKPFTLDALLATLVMHAKRRKTGVQQVFSLRCQDQVPLETNWPSAGYR